MRAPKFVTLLAASGLVIALAACGGGGGGGTTTSVTPADSGTSSTAAPTGPAEGLVIIADPSSTHDVLAAALAQDALSKFFFTSRSMDPASFDGITFAGDDTTWGTQPTKPFADDAEFLAAYEDTYGVSAADIFGASAAYDSVYVIALAAVAANAEDHGAIRDAITYVANSPGDVVGPGSESFGEARTAITGGADVNYIGASGQMDFDGNGEIAKSSVQTWRVINGTIAPIETRDVDITAESGVAIPAGNPPVPSTLPDGALAIGVIINDDDNGNAIADAAQLAVDEINAAGGVWETDVVLNVQSLSAQDQASHAAGLLVTDDGVDAIIGPQSLEAANSALSTVAADNVAMLTLTTDPALTSVEDPNGVLFRAVASDAIQMPALANLFLEGYATPTPTEGIAPGEGPLPGSVCVVYQAGAGSEQMAAAYEAAMEHKGATIRASVSFDPAAVDYAALLSDCIGS